MVSSDNKRESEQFRKLFIGGLDYRTSDDSLRKFFETWGEIVDVVVMKDPMTKRSRGFGFITYSESSMVDEAMTNRPHKIDGREVETKRAVPRDEIGKPEANLSVKKLFVGGIKDSVGEEDLKEYFSTYGNVVNVAVPINKETQSKRGFAFVEFDDYDPVDKVISKRHTINGRSLDVKKAMDKNAPPPKGGSGGGGRGGRGGRGGDGGGGWNSQGGNMGPQGGGWGGNTGYGGSPWDDQSGGYGGQMAQGWGAPAQSQGYGAPQPWGGQQSQGYQQQGYGGGPMRSNTYSGTNRSAPYGTGASSGGYGGGNMGGYSSGGAGGRRY